MSFHMEAVVRAWGEPLEVELPDDYTYLGVFTAVTWTDGATAATPLVDVEVVVPDRTVTPYIPATTPGSLSATPLPVSHGLGVGRVVVPDKTPKVSTLFEVRAMFFSQQPSYEAATRRQAKLHLVTSSREAPQPDPGRHVWPLGLVSTPANTGMMYQAYTGILYVEE